MCGRPGLWVQRGFLGPKESFQDEIPGWEGGHIRLGIEAQFDEDLAFDGLEPGGIRRGGYGVDGRLMRNFLDEAMVVIRIRKGGMLKEPARGAVVVPEEDVTGRCH